MTLEIIQNKSQGIMLTETKTTELKLFTSANPEEVQQSVNLWLQENPVQIKHVGQSQSEKNGRFIFVISLFFER